MNATRAGLAVALTVVCLAAGCTAEPSPPEPASQVTYSCCADLDEDAVHHPGQALTVRWTVEAPDGPVTGGPQVELTATLSGPYAAVEEIKTEDLARSEAVFTAEPVRPSGDPEERPVSTIMIGPDAKAGFYSLYTAVTQDGATSAGYGIVRVDRA